MSQLDLFGGATPVEEVDWPASLRHLSGIERERGIKLDPDEAGALIHHRRGKHDADKRCRYCTTDGQDALDRLRNRRPLEETSGSRTDGTSSRLADTEGPVSSSGQAGPPVARSTDPQTSHDAADSVENVTDLQARIVELLEQGPMTDVAIAAAYAIRHDWPPATPSGLRTRRHELVEAGRVIQYGIACERGRGGRSHTVWALASGRGPVHDPEPEL